MGVLKEMYVGVGGLPFPESAVTVSRCDLGDVCFGAVLDKLVGGR